MSDGRCARCQSTVTEHDLEAGRGASLGAMVLCERCAAPAEENKPAARPVSKQSSSVQVITPASSALPAVVPFSEAAVPIAQSAFFKDLDAEGLGSSDQPAPTTAVAVEAHHPAEPAPRRPEAPREPRKVFFAGVACGAGSFALVLMVYLAFLHTAPDSNPAPVKPNRTVAIPAKLELPPPTRGIVETPAAPVSGQGKPQLVASRNLEPAPEPSQRGPSVRIAEEAFEAIRRVPDTDLKEKRRLLEAFLKDYEKVDIALTARARVMLEQFQPFQVRMDFEGKLSDWEAWEGSLKTHGRKAHSGERALISGPNNNGGGIWLKGVQPGKTYTATIWSKRDPDVADCYIGIEFGTANKEKMAKQVFKPEWTEYEKRTLEGVAPANSVYLYFWIWREKGKGEVCIDDVEIIEK